MHGAVRSVDQSRPFSEAKRVASARVLDPILWETEPRWALTVQRLTKSSPAICALVMPCAVRSVAAYSHRYGKREVLPWYDCTQPEKMPCP